MTTKQRMLTGAIGGSEFKFFVPQLTASIDENGKAVFSGIASSTVQDLHGDTMAESALADMQAAAIGLTIFLNHEYRVPEDVAGKCVSAHIERSGDVADLHFDRIEVQPDNPRAILAHKEIRGGVRLGLSIGAMIPEGGAHYDKTTKGWIIEHVTLLETSIVGVPANPRSFIQNAAKSLRTPVEHEEVAEEVITDPVTTEEVITETVTIAEVPVHAHAYDPKDAVDGVMSPDAPCVTCGILKSHSELPDSAFACISPGGKKEGGKTVPLSLRHYPHHTASGGVDTALLKNALSRLGDASNEQCGKAHIEAHARALGIGEESEKALTEADLIEVLNADFDVDHFLALAGTNFSHEHNHAHAHEHEHSHTDGLTHTHEHGHVHSHDHDHGTTDHAHNDEWNTRAHDHSHGSDGGEHPHDNTAEPSDNDSDNAGGASDDDEDNAQTKTASTVWVKTPDGTEITVEDTVAEAAPKAAEPNPEASQGAEDQSSNPETEDESGLLDETGPGDDELLGDEKTKAVMELLEPAIAASLKTSGDLVEMLAARLVEQQKSAQAANEERDAVVKLARETLSQSAAVLDRVMKTPMGRRAIVREAVTEMTSLSEVISPAALEILRSHKTGR